ncbi:MAG: hypothetical protein ACK419_06345, partial [Pyrinomonadaceae bacterium]
GDPRDKLSEEELRQKFQVLAEGVLSKEQQQKVFEAIYNLESLENTAELMRLVSKPESFKVEQS